MSWISMLSQTYDNSPHLWGLTEDGEPAGSIPLLLVGQSTQNAQIEVLLNASADIIDAFAITDKKSQVTVIPCTEGSIGRVGSKIAPHPLHDKLQYIAGDYVAFGGEKNHGYQEYMDQINAWCDSPHSHPKVRVIRDYLKRGTLIQDLVSTGLMPVEHGKLVRKPSQEQKDQYPLLQISGLDPLEAFVRFRVSLPGDVVSQPWLDPSIAESFNAWQLTQDRFRGLCYVSGASTILSQNHPSKLRHTGDKAKLISANDSSGFTFKGRFLDDSQAVGVSYEVSQKAHNMLKWLISRQGFRNDSQVFVAWGTKLQPMPKLEDDTDEMCGIQEDAAQTSEQEEQLHANLRRDYAGRLKKAMAGYSKRISDADHVVVMGIDSATPGRMSVIFYRELAGTDFLSRIERWHTRCSWLHTYKFKEKKRVPFIGAPAPTDIALAAYGNRANEKLVKATVENLLRCIVDSKPVPPGIRHSLIRRAGNPVAMEAWEWQKTLSIACAIVRAHLIESKGGEWTMALETNNQDRSYLFGRLLAYAQHIESYSQYVTEKSHRQTNAERMMHQFSLRPAKTWAMLNLRLQPYLRQLKRPGLTSWWSTETLKLMDALGTAGFTNQPLEEQYLLGYSSQMMDLRYNKENQDEEEENDNGTEA